MITRRVKPEDMRPGRRYTIEIPADFAGTLNCSYDDPSWYDPANWSNRGIPFETSPVRHNSITLKFSDLKGTSGGITITEYVDWETGAVYKSKLNGKLYQRESDGWLCLKHKGESSYGIPDYGARKDFESSLVKLVEEKK